MPTHKKHALSQTVDFLREEKEIMQIGIPLAE